MPVDTHHGTVIQMTNALALHLMVRHGVDAMADVLLDGCSAAVRSGANACVAAYAAASAGARAPMTVGSTAPLDLRAQRLYRHSMS